MITFRIYRLPGSREWWLIDTGEGTTVVKAQNFELRGITSTVDGDPTKQPRAWLKFEADFLHVIDNVAIFGWSQCK